MKISDCFFFWSSLSDSSTCLTCKSYLPPPDRPWQCYTTQQAVYLFACLSPLWRSTLPAYILPYPFKPPQSSTAVRDPWAGLILLHRTPKRSHFSCLLLRLILITTEALSPPQTVTLQTRTWYLFSLHFSRPLCKINSSARISFGLSQLSLGTIVSSSPLS